MGLVNSQQTYSTRDALDTLYKALVVKAFGGDVEEPQLGFAHAGVDQLHLLPAFRRVDAICSNSPFSQLVHLVLHERKQRGHDDGEPSVVSGSCAFRTVEFRERDTRDLIIIVRSTSIYHGIVQNNNTW